MNHAITIGGLIATFGIIGGVLITLFGFIAFFAGMMSDAPEVGDNSGKVGCSLIIAGVLIAGFCIWSLT